MYIGMKNIYKCWNCDPLAIDSAEIDSIGQLLTGLVAEQVSAANKTGNSWSLRAEATDRYCLLKKALYIYIYSINSL